MKSLGRGYSCTFPRDSSKGSGEHRHFTRFFAKMTRRVVGSRYSSEDDAGKAGGREHGAGSLGELEGSGDGESGDDIGKLHEPHVHGIGEGNGHEKARRCTKQCSRRLVPFCGYRRSDFRIQNFLEIEVRTAKDAKSAKFLVWYDSNSQAGEYTIHTQTDCKGHYPFFAFLGVLGGSTFQFEYGRSAPPHRVVAELRCPIGWRAARTVRVGRGRPSKTCLTAATGLGAAAQAQAYRQRTNHAH